MKTHKKFFIKPKIYIFCNGELAEPNYFQEFKDYLRANTIVIVHSKFKNLSPWGFIKRAVEERERLINQQKFDEKTKDQCWCVFDIDNYSKENPKEFAKGVKLAIKNNIKLAWSNECFELWYLLHFQPVSTAIPRREYNQRLKKLFRKLDGKNYSKNDKGIFERLLTKQSDAIRNGKKILTEPKDNPSTSLSELVEEINKVNLK